MGWRVSHCGVLVGGRCIDCLHRGPDPGHQLHPQQEAPQASLVQQCLQQHPLVHLCQGGSCTTLSIALQQCEVHAFCLWLGAAGHCTATSKHLFVLCLLTLLLYCVCMVLGQGLAWAALTLCPACHCRVAGVLLAAPLERPSPSRPPSRETTC